MTNYLISFPSGAMNIADDEFAAVGDAAHAVIQQAKDGGLKRAVSGIEPPADAHRAAGLPRRPARLSGKSLRPAGS
jgi:hypothetical protein